MGPQPKGTTFNLSASYTDASTGQTYSCSIDWDDPTGTFTAGTITPNSSANPGTCTGSHTYNQAGVYTITVRVTDSCNASGESTYQYVVVYDPNAGFVTGGGWINSPPGAYTPNASLFGKTNFGFVSKYKKGASVPEGETEFQFHVASFNFKSTVYEWLVISGTTKAQYKGSGTVNGTGNYGFLLTAWDTNPDRFRIKIWDKTTNVVVYDNRLGVPPDDVDTADPQEIGGGSIVVHKSK
jgi:hypothetical protein